MIQLRETIATKLEGRPYHASLHAAALERRERLNHPPIKAAPVMIEPAAIAEPQPAKRPWWPPQLSPVYQEGDEPAAPPPILIRDIKKSVCRFYDVALIDLMSERRTHNIVRPRQIAMYLTKTLTTRSLPYIGSQFGGKDHTTVLHAVRKITQLMESDNKMAADVAALKRSLTE